MRVIAKPLITARSLLVVVIALSAASCQSYVPVLPKSVLGTDQPGSTPTESAAETTLSDLPPRSLQIPARVAPLPKRSERNTAVQAVGGLAPLSDTCLPAPLEIDDSAIKTITDQPPSPRKRQRLSRYELLYDGGDRLPKAHVRRDWDVLGLDPEDTIVHYDTLGGRTEVSPSNRVAVYAPRFAATRQVNNVIQYERVSPASRVRVMTTPYESDRQADAETVKQNLATVREIGDTVPQAVEDRQRGLNAVQTDVAHAMIRRLLPFENLEVVRTGVYDSAEAPFVEKYTQAAQAWTDIQTVQLVLDNKPASVLAKTTAANEAFEYVLPDGKARVRIIKLASTSAARAGDYVRFTLRFDNVGDEAVGNVTIIDNLTTRFEYVADSQECSLTADFSAEDNAGQSSLLRWKIADPLEPGDGGIIRFEVRVR